MNGVSGSVRLREGKRGDVYYVKYRAHGKQKQRRLGPAWTERSRPPKGYYTKKTAEAELQAILTDARREGPPSAREMAIFSAAAYEYLRYVEDVRQIDPATLADYRGVIDGYLLAEFGDSPLDGITADAIESYRDRLLDGGDLSNRTIVRHLTVLHGIFKRAQRAYGLAQNPAAAEMVERPRVVYTAEFDTFDPSEIQRMIGAADSAQDAAIYCAAAYTGLRTGELLALRWGAVDFVGGLLHVKGSFDYKRHVEKVPKGKKVRSVPMVPEVVNALARLKEREHFTGDGDLVFCSEAGEHLDYYSHLRRFKDTLKRAGLRELRFHDLRHAFGSAAITKLDPYAVQSYMGHAHYSTTQRYLHHKPRRDDAARIADAFLVTNLVPNSGTSTATEDNPEQLSVPGETEDHGT
jgi:integrase